MKAIIWIFLSLTVCSFIAKKAVHEQNVEFEIFPRIIVQSDLYKLEYQVKIDSQDSLQLKRVVLIKRKANKLYFYFSLPTSHFEDGKVVRTSLRQYKDIKEFTFFWINADGDKQILDVITQ